MTHLDTGSPLTSSSEAPIGNRFNCPDIWFHLSCSHSVSPGLTNDGPPTTWPGERRACLGHVSHPRITEPAGLRLPDRSDPRGLQREACWGRGQPAPINTPSPEQAARCQGSGKICGCPEQEGWVAGEPSGRARLVGDPGAGTANVLVPRAEEGLEGRGRGTLS